MASRPYTARQNDWLIESKRDGSRSGPLKLRWELDGTAMSDDYMPDEISAHELLVRWVDRYSYDRRAEEMYGRGMVSIFWHVDMPCNAEIAPFCADVGIAEDFLTHFRWPVNSVTGERVNWNRLPVLDMAWNRRRSDKGGFFQEATGWKPSPMQPAVYLAGVLAAANIPGLVAYRPRVRPD